VNSESIRVSIILVSFNSLPAIGESLTALRDRSIEVPSELIVVDNGSDDGTLEMIAGEFPEVRLIRNAENLGFAAACNLGVSHSKGEFVLFHNPDLVLDDGALGGLVSEFSKIVKAGAASGRMRFPDGSFQATCRNFPTVTRLLFSRGSFLSRIAGGSGVYTLPDFESVTEVPAVAGTLMIVRRDVFEQIGGFDPRFFMYMEDTDLCFRLNRAGYHNYYIPSAGGVHLWGEGSRAGKMKRARYHHRSVRKYFAKHFPGFVSLIILPLLLSVNLLLTALVPPPNGRKSSE
jgi:GT2 family glycosyltransferase